MEHEPIVYGLLVDKETIYSIVTILALVIGKLWHYSIRSEKRCREENNKLWKAIIHLKGISCGNISCDQRVPVPDFPDRRVDQRRKHVRPKIFNRNRRSGDERRDKNLNMFKAAKF